MTNPSGNRDTIWLSGFRGGLEKMACHPRLRLGRQTIFPDPPESLESNSITCHPLDQSLFVYCLKLFNITRNALSCNTLNING